MTIRAHRIDTLHGTQHSETFTISDKVLEGRSDEERTTLVNHYLLEWSKKFVMLSYERIDDEE